MCVSQLGINTTQTELPYVYSARISLSLLVQRHLRTHTDNFTVLVAKHLYTSEQMLFKDVCVLYLKEKPTEWWLGGPEAPLHSPRNRISPAVTRACFLESQFLPPQESTQVKHSSTTQSALPKSSCAKYNFLHIVTSSVMFWQPQDERLRQLSCSLTCFPKQEISSMMKNQSS